MPFLKVWDGVFMVGGPELTSMEDCCIYAVDGGSEGFVLIDSGLGLTYNSVVENLMDAGLNPKRLKVIIATHCHVDHVGGLSKFKRDYSPTIAAHELDAEAIETGDPKRLGLELYGVAYEPCKVDLKFKGSEESLRVGDVELTVLHIPGHTPGSIAVYADVYGQRMLFGQDIHGPFNPEWGSNLEEWRRSIEKLLQLDADVLLEGHFGVIQPARAVRDFLRDYLEIMS
ncbi:MAG: Zn-dependent hydrolase [Thermoprotei archaeon]|nr:MAG: Zn-dependent hydrolase [Thermoprotei archaeon]